MLWEELNYTIFYIACEITTHEIFIQKIFKSWSICSSSHFILQENIIKHNVLLLILCLFINRMKMHNFDSSNLISVFSLSKKTLIRWKELVTHTLVSLHLCHHTIFSWFQTYFLPCYMVVYLSISSWANICFCCYTYRFLCIYVYLTTKLILSWFYVTLYVF